MALESITSAIYNNVVSGASGVNVNNRFTLEQIEDDAIRTRLAIIKEYSMKNLIPVKDLILPINCLAVDCESLDRCCTTKAEEEKVKHTEIPQLINDFGSAAIDFLGSTDRRVRFKVYTDSSWRHHKFNRRGADQPYAWVDTAPNANNMYDVFLFNLPLITSLSVVGIFKDPRQVAEFGCCNGIDVYNDSFLDKEIIKRVTEEYIRYYRQMATAHTPNDQAVK